LKNVYACDAFGNTLAGVEEVYSYNAKSGYYYDSETGFYYCLQRYYDPANGRWLTEDPIGYEGGLNLYGYCGNSPVGSVDASGLAWNWGEFGIEVGISTLTSGVITCGIYCIAAAGAPIIIPVAIGAGAILLLAEGIELGINIYYRNETRGASWENLDEVIHERYGSNEKICGNLLGNIIGGYGGSRIGEFAGNKILYIRAMNAAKKEIFNNRFQEIRNTAKESDGYDCSEIADDLYNASGGKGEIYEITSKKSNQISIPEEGKNYPEPYFYHQVYSNGNLIYDPRLSCLPIRKYDYLYQLRKLNPDGINIKKIQ
jgi:RHS repeat-associated protein